MLTGFVTMAADGPDDAHLMLAGPDVSGVTDDPEGADVLAECRARWRTVPESIRGRVHLASIPMDDVDENAIIINALQRHAYLVVQKSLVEGFGLTVTEAMWKARPMIASRVGGIQDQIVHERDGLLLDDPYDLDALAAAMARLLDDRELADRLGAAGRARVHDQFLGDRHLAQYVDLFEHLSRLTALAASRDPAPNRPSSSARRDERRGGLAVSGRRRVTMSSAVGQVPADETPATTASLLAPFERDVLLATGRAVHVRPASPRDVERLRSFYQQLDDTSTYSRFFGLRPFIPDDELQRATVQDVHQQVTLIAESDGSIIGVGEYHARPGGVEAEVAFAVADAHHHEGVATVLLEDLALVARAAGFRRLAADTLPGNMAMLGVFRTVGLVHRHWFEDGVVCVQLDLTADDLLQDHADLRDWRAAVRSLRSIVAPSHVVVIGADRDESSPGRRILAHLRDSFSGRVSVVHATADVVGGIDAVATLDELDEVPDLAVIAVPAPLVAGVVAQCGTVGVPSAVVISAGFAELGAEGARMQDQVLVAARRYGMRIVGPNCLGVVSTACGLNATFTSQQFVPGGIAIASQSGGVGIAIAAEAQRRHAGISSFVSMGNKIDVSGNDLLRLWADDEQTNVVLLYLESFGDPVRFARVARAVSQRKPVVALKSGRTAAGRRGAVSHTAAVAADQVVVDALLAHTGVLRAGGTGGTDRRRAAARPAGRSGRAPGRIDRQRRRAAGLGRRRRRRRRSRRTSAVAAAPGRDREPGADGGVD